MDNSDLEYTTVDPRVFEQEPWWYEYISWRHQYPYAFEWYINEASIEEEEPWWYSHISWRHQYPYAFEWYVNEALKDEGEISTE